MTTGFSLRSLFVDDKIDKALIASFLVIYCGMYYAQFSKLIAISYVILIILFIKSLFQNKKLIHTKYLAIGICFISYSFITTIWAINIELSLVNLLNLIKAFIISYIFINCLNTSSKIKWAIYTFMLSGIIFSYIYITNVNIAELQGNRIGTATEDFENLPNVNIVSISASFSFLFFLYNYIRSKNKLSLFFTMISAILTILLGSRKSILTILIASILILCKSNRSQQLKIIFLILGCLAITYLIIPQEYLAFVIDRTKELFTSTPSSMDEADETRHKLLEYGISYFFKNPIFGFGFYNFSQLFGNDTGIFYYSHNNFIELAVGGGIISLILYYSFFYISYKNITKTRLCLDDNFLLLLLIFLMLFNHISIVLILSRYSWIFIAIIYSYSFILKKI